MRTKRFSEKRFNGITGLICTLDLRITAIISRKPARKLKTVLAPTHPQLLPSRRAKTTMAIPPIAPKVPEISTLSRSTTVWSFDQEGTLRRIINRLIGTTVTNKSRQDAYSTNIEEKIGPLTPAIAVHTAHLPNAVARTPSSVSRTMIAIELTPNPASAAA